VVPATQVDIDLTAERETKVLKFSDSDGVTGMVLFSYVSGFRLGHHFYRGPHFQITPAFYRKFWLTWPLSGRFSSKGDSGAWVVDTETRQWLGMVIGGFPLPNTLTVALSAEHICDAFGRSQLPGASSSLASATAVAADVFQEREKYASSRYAE
jgi:hypothetical protein